MLIIKGYVVDSIDLCLKDLQKPNDKQVSTESKHIFSLEETKCLLYWILKDIMWIPLIGNRK